MLRLVTKFKPSGNHSSNSPFKTIRVAIMTHVLSSLATAPSIYSATDVKSCVLPACLHSCISTTLHPATYYQCVHAGHEAELLICLGRPIFNTNTKVPGASQHFHASPLHSSRLFFHTCLCGAPPPAVFCTRLSTADFEACYCTGRFLPPAQHRALPARSPTVHSRRE